MVKSIVYVYFHSNCNNEHWRVPSSNLEWAYDNIKLGQKVHFTVYLRVFLFGSNCLQEVIYSSYRTVYLKIQVFSDIFYVRDSWLNYNNHTLRICQIILKVYTHVFSWDKDCFPALGTPLVALNLLSRVLKSNHLNE